MLEPGREPRPDRSRTINQKNPHPHPKECRTGTLLGTDFRHAVEFSRNGRTPTPPSRASSAAGSSTLRRPPEACTPRVLSAALAGPSGAAGSPPPRRPPEVGPPRVLSVALAGSSGAKRTVHDSGRACTRGPRHQRGRRSEPQERLQPDGQPRPVADVAHGQQDARHERGPVVGVVAQGERLPRRTHEHLLGRPPTGEPDGGRGE